MQMRSRFGSASKLQTGGAILGLTRCNGMQMRSRFGSASKLGTGGAAGTAAAAVSSSGGPAEDRRWLASGC
eukprot:SM010471S14118  [mRNA]  locus=s10471:190:497:+ [translate_table: standard]